MKVKDILKRLQEEGWYLARQRGSHRQFKHDALPERRVTVSGKPSDDIAPGTVGSIYEQAGWEKDIP